MTRKVAVWLGLVATTAAWRRWRPFAVAVDGNSMAPELLPGDWLIAVRRRRLRRGDLVVVEHPERPGFELVKWLSGLPGDTVGALRLGADQHWVTGLAPEASTDSTWFGPVPGSALKGRIVLRYRPLARARVFPWRG